VARNYFLLEIFCLAGLESYIAGWGLTNQTANVWPTKLQVLKVKIIDWNICKSKRPVKFQIWQVCAGVPVRNKAACNVIKKYIIEPITQK